VSADEIRARCLGRHAIKACREAGVPVVDTHDCSCDLNGQLVVVVQPDGLRVGWPYDEPCAVHGPQDTSTPSPATAGCTGRARSLTTDVHAHPSERPDTMTHAVPERARRLAEQLDKLFGQDAALATRLNAAYRRLHAANDRLWWGFHPDGLASVYCEDPAAVDVAFAEHRSEVLGAADPLAAIQQVHWSIRSAAHDYQAAAEERRQLAGHVGEVIRQFVDALVAAGWSEEQARTTNIHELAQSNPATPRRN